MIQFILNDEAITTTEKSGVAMLDFIRENQKLKGSKLVCKEGECGACMIMVGSRIGIRISYQIMTSCIMPLVNAQGKHIVTIEGLNMEKLSPVQQALVDTFGTQCGFCTPGFVVSLTSYLMSNKVYSKDGIIESIDGNICRCTGYKSIERAAEIILDKVKKDIPRPSLTALVRAGFIPKYFSKVGRMLTSMEPKQSKISIGVKLGGGTDLYVQKPDVMYASKAIPVYDQPVLKTISINKGVCTFGASLTMGDLYRSSVFRRALPDSDYVFKLLSSTPIRNMSTIGGNLANASPIGDFTIILLGLNSRLILKNNNRKRKIFLKDFYKGYKIMDLGKTEYIEKIEFDVPDKSSVFHFEKVSLRKYLDIASVNFSSSISIQDNQQIRSIHLAVGGVGPIPMYLKKTSEFLSNKVLDEDIILSSIQIMNQEISPISDTRGSAEYKRLLARQLLIASFLNIDNTCYDVNKLVGA